MPSEAPQIEILYTVGEISGALRRSEKFVRSEIHGGRLKGYRIGDQLRIREEDYLAWLETLRATDGPAPYKNRYLDRAAK